MFPCLHVGVNPPASNTSTLAAEPKLIWLHSMSTEQKCSDVVSKLLALIHSTVWLPR